VITLGPFMDVGRSMLLAATGGARVCRALAEALIRDRPAGPRPAVVCLGVGLLGAAIALRFSLSDPAEPVSLLALLPIAILAIELGQPGGSVAAAVTVAALAVWSALENVRLGFLELAPRVGTFFLVALAVGYLYERLQSSRETQRRLFEWSVEPLIGIDIDGQVRSANSKALGLFERMPDEMINHPEFLPGFFPKLSARTIQGCDPSRPHPLSLQDGAEGGVPLEVSVVPWESEDGALLLSLRPDRSVEVASAGREQGRRSGG
jgi:hypothetical protein